MMMDPRDCSGSTEWSSGDSSSDSLQLSSPRASTGGGKFAESPSSPPRRVVRFDLRDGGGADISPLGIAPGALAVGVDSHLCSSLESLTAPELRDRLERAVQALQQTQIDLAAERAQRRRKEKTIVKVAKELNRRISESEKKSKAIKALDASLRDTERKLEAALVVAKSQIADHRCAKLRDELRESHREHDEATLALRSRVAELREEKDFLKSQLLAVKMENQRAPTAYPHVKLPSVLIVLLVAMALAWMKFSILNAVCPVR